MTWHFDIRHTGERLSRFFGERCISSADGGNARLSGSNRAVVERLPESIRDYFYYTPT